MIEDIYLLFVTNVHFILHKIPQNLMILKEVRFFYGYYPSYSSFKAWVYIDQMIRAKIFLEADYEKRKI